VENLSKNKRDKIIAAAACSLIFLIVMTITIVTITRGSTPSRPLQQQYKLTPPPKQEYKLQRQQKTEKEAPNRPQYGNFASSNMLELPARFKKYKYSAGIIVDLTNRRILWAKNEDKILPIASISKLMTLYTALDIMKQRGVGLKTTVEVTRRCTLENPVKAPLKVGSKISLDDLFKYAMLKSANDAAYLIAEYFGNGDAGSFIRKMNSQARSIGMKSSHFVNANGLPIYQGNYAKMNKSSCMDLILLMERIAEQPQIMRYTAMKEALMPDGKEIKNGNRLLGSVRGMNGMKTGYTNAAGHCLAFSCKRNNRMLIGVVLGCPKRERDIFTRELIEWGFDN